MTRPDPVDDAVLTYYGSAKPSEALLEKLRPLADDANAPPPEVAGSIGPNLARHAAWAWSVAGLAAVIALVLGIGIFNSRPTHEDITALAHTEIALNHRKQLDSEWETHDIGVLRRTMDKLPFNLRLPDGPAWAGYQLIGGRYCSIDGELAAQLRVTGPDGKPCTLYVLADVPALDGIDTAGTSLGDVRVETWRSRGLLYGLARDLDPQSL
ncbi:MAG: hypothetical protein AAF586_00305 [Planctomycetota bacterium]